MSTKKRRYPSGQNTIYDNTYNAMRVNSRVLNAGVREYDYKYAFSMSSKQEVQAQYYSIARDIAVMVREEKSVQQAFQTYKAVRKEQGFPEPTELPSELQDKLSKIHAYMDIYKAELDYLRGVLQKFTDAATEKRKELMLRHGPRQSARLEHGLIVEIDGQRVDRINGVRCIADPLSPYNGMPLSAYREMALSWAREYDRVRAEKEAQRVHEIRTRGHSDIPYYNRQAHIPREYLPKLPEGVPNMTKPIPTKSKRTKR